MTASPQLQQPRPAAVADRADPTFDHGFQRAPEVEPAPPPVAPRRPTGLPLVLLLALGMLTAVGVVQVRTRARVLELGAEIAELTVEHGRLLDDKRRLEAERAYLRHPDYIQSVAASRLHMVPATPDRIQAIRVRGAAAERPSESQKPGPSEQEG